MKNFYIYFETTEARRSFARGLIEYFYQPRKGENKHIRETREYYLNSMDSRFYAYYNLYKIYRGGWEPEPGEKYVYSPYEPLEVFKSGIRSLYYQGSYYFRPGCWLVVNLRQTDKGRDLYEYITNSIPTERMGTNVPLPERSRMQLKLKEIRRLLDLGKKPINDLDKQKKALDIIYKQMMEIMVFDPELFRGDKVYMWEDLAALFYNVDNLNKMEACLRKQVKLRSKCADPFLNMGVYYKNKGMINKAIEAYRDGLEVNPKDEFIHYNLSALLMDIGDARYARKKAKETLKDGNNIDINNMLLANMHFEEGDYHRAMKYYKECLKEGLKNIGAEMKLRLYNCLIASYVMMEDLDGAKAAALEAVRQFDGVEDSSLKFVFDGEQQEIRYTSHYDLLDRKIYDGQITNGQSTGFGIVYNPDWKEDALFYIGELKENKFHGLGREYHKDGAVKYEGRWHMGKKHGFGTSYDIECNLEYQGEYIHGEACDIWNAHIVENGQLIKVNDIPDGEVKLFYSNGRVMYEGGIYNNRYEGEGTLYLQDGMPGYTGTWANGLRNGNVIEYYSSGQMKYNGEWESNRKSGYGIGYWENGLVWYEGSFSGNLPYGEGRIYYKNGVLRYEGQFKNGEFKGQGREYYDNGQLKFEGKFKWGPYFLHGVRYYGEGTKYDRKGNVIEEVQKD